MRVACDAGGKRGTRLMGVLLLFLNNGIKKVIHVCTRMEEVFYVVFSAMARILMTMKYLMTLITKRECWQVKYWWCTHLHFAKKKACVCQCIFIWGEYRRINVFSMFWWNAAKIVENKLQERAFFLPSRLLHKSLISRVKCMGAGVQHFFYLYRGDG